MKRLVWLLLIVFVMALAHVSPVDTGVQNQTSCSCCDTAGACDMADCALPPPCASTTLLAEQPATSIRATARRNAVRPRVALENFLRVTEIRQIDSVARDLSLKATAQTQVPLFKAHCSFLI